jgi:hypothetical protein
MANRLTDTTTLTAVESLFHDGNRDPWARELAGKLADWYAYSETPSFVMPETAIRPGGLDATPVPKIVRDLRRLDSATMHAQFCPTGTELRLIEELQNDTLDTFLAWCQANPTRLKAWVQLHNQPWVTGGHLLRLPHRYLYNVDQVLSQPRFRSCANELQLPPSELGYALDVVLRYAVYGEAVGEHGIYLSHPIREQIQLPTMIVEPHKVPQIALSFAASVSELAPSLNMDQYTSLLHEIRRIVVDGPLFSIKPGTMENEKIRQIAADLNLPAKLRGWSKAAGVAAGMLSGLALFPALATTATVVGVAISVGSIFCDGSLPRGLAKIKWARWAMQWDLENEEK